MFGRYRGRVQNLSAEVPVGKDGKPLVCVEGRNAYLDPVMRKAALDDMAKASDFLHYGAGYRIPRAASGDADKA